ncbi:hypothetical protein FRB98_009092 [Tulasnella sp. 332]|nr:hypothetical protein FRB98_009092 [Tulasnella sp. 332]
MQVVRALMNGTVPNEFAQNWIAFNVNDRSNTCQNQRLGDTDPGYTAVPIRMDLDLAVTLFANWSLGQSQDPLGDNSTAIINAMQTLLTVALLDIGNVYPNNFLAYLDSQIILNATIVSEFAIRGAPSSPSFPSCFMKSSPTIQPVMKSTGQLIVSVLVATLSMFSSGWAISILVSAHFEKRRYPRGLSDIENTGALIHGLLERSLVQ